jgi:group I intron endonuclease
MINTGLNISGIYKITSKVHPERIYIGSAVNFRQRKNTHFLSLKKGKHKNPKLQAHYNKYGDADLLFCIVAICSKEDLMPVNNIVWLEQFFIDAYNPWFNCSPTAGSSLGIKRSQDTIDKMKGRRMSQETIDKISFSKLGSIPWNKGMKGQYKMPPDTEGKRGAKLKNKKRPPFSDEWIKNLSESHKGIKQSEESKRKKSEKLKGHDVSQGTRNKLSIANTGKKKPPLTKERSKAISDAVTEWWRKRKEMELNKDVA